MQTPHLTTATSDGTFIPPAWWVLGADWHGFTPKSLASLRRKMMINHGFYGIKPGFIIIEKPGNDDKPWETLGILSLLQTIGILMDFIIYLSMIMINHWGWK